MWSLKDVGEPIYQTSTRLWASILWRYVNDMMKNKRYDIINDIMYSIFFMPTVEITVEITNISLTLSGHLSKTAMGNHHHQADVWKNTWLFENPICLVKSPLCAGQPPHISGEIMLKYQISIPTILGKRGKLVFHIPFGDLTEGTGKSPLLERNITIFRTSKSMGHHHS